MGNERPRDADAVLLAQIQALLGGGTASAGGTHTITAVDTTYRQLTDGTSPALVSDPTSDQKLIVRVYLNNLASGDTLDIGVDTEVSDGSWMRVNYSYTGAQTNQQYVDFSLQTYNGLGSRIFVRQTAGTARSMVYRVIAGQALA